MLGGGRPADFPKGYFVEPTLFADVDNSMTIAQEEIFGPVLVVIPFEDDDDAVRIANESHYGLAGGVISGSEERALRRPPHPGRVHRASTGACGTAPTPPSAATRPAGSGASAASRVSSSTPRPRRSPGPRPEPGRARSGLGQASDHSASSSSVVVRRATNARLCLSMEA